MEQVPEEKVLDELPFRGEVEVTHPAFGMLGVTRWTSSAAVRMFGSDMGHGGGVTLTLQTASTRRGLSRDWHHAERIVAELTMSESQWARLVSSIGQGEGVPVTLVKCRDGGLSQLPAIAAPKLSKAAMHTVEMEASLKH
jgi:hypothetical protein